MLIFAPTEIYIRRYICCIYVYVYMYIIPNFIENCNLKFETNNVMIKGLLEDFCLAMYVIVFLPSYPVFIWNKYSVNSQFSI
jgi:hypothetical protein